MQQYSTDILKQITELAALFFTPREVAMMLELDIDDFVMECDLSPKSDGYLAFHSGRLQSEVDLRKSIMKLAKSGSSPAQTMAMDILLKSKVKMIDK
jgi:hypothetical protein